MFPDEEREYLMPMNVRQPISAGKYGVTAFILSLTLFSLFIVPLFPFAWMNRMYPLSFSCIFLSAAYSVRGKHSLLFRASLLVAVLTAISSFAAEGSFKSAARIVQFFFFILLVVALINQISASPEVSGKVIMDAVAAYLLLGIAFGITVIVADSLVDGAYSEPLSSKNAGIIKPDIRDALYYAFVTYTTTGYGDITPRHPLTKSLAMLISISGQLYVAIILALLVGKFASRKTESTKNT